MPSVLIDNRAFIGVSGADAQHFLHNLVTADIEGLPADEWWLTALLTAQGKVTLHTTTYPLDAINDAMADLDNGRLQGRGILVPAAA